MSNLEKESSSEQPVHSIEKHLEEKKNEESQGHLDETTTTSLLQRNMIVPNSDDHLSEQVRILKDAFPSTDVEVIEAVLQSQNNNMEATIESLLAISDPSYTPSVPVASEQQTPPMPPRPSKPNNRPPYTYWEDASKTGIHSVEEQVRMDEELARKLAMEDEMRTQQLRPKQQWRQEEEPIFNFQELPLIKEKMKEAGNAAKKKMLNFYNQLKANTQKNTNQNYQHESSSMPTTNALYRGLPSDDGDDLLTGDISALHLSDYDVYAKTGGKTRNSNEYKKDNDVIYVNSPLNTTRSLQTSTSEAQLKADENFARQLAEEESREARRLSSNMTVNTTLQPPQMPPRKSVSPTVVISTRSPLEYEGDSDYEDVGLTVASTTESKNNKIESPNNDELETDNNNVPYVIGDDDDDSDSEDNLIDDIEEEEEDNKSKKDDIATITTTNKENATAAAAAVLKCEDEDTKKDNEKPSATTK
ncbi:uncharacterized protein BX663DRAFT_85547 [Cokeromyces recurvatus]|uniref:uncharacterized protein n=1 Tax=Cokeromyces recurvatus TaxID=90255 RepID=UPI0022204569|nr:uncharacterized protein BX663DRAFT_85547 [Cokeromyces recurvatus]KAI7902209.1 hypothetical protein BX663DRAFT_85547 [Cokeromyces recurvatus]